MARRSGGSRMVLMMVLFALTRVFRRANEAFAAPQCSPPMGEAGPLFGLRRSHARADASQITQQVCWGCSSASEPIRHTLHIGVKIQQWWDHWIGPVDLDRQGLKISGMETYAVVATVLLQVVVGFYGGVAQPEEGCSKRERFCYDLQMVLMMIATLCSTFTFITFLLNKVCDVTALGLYKDVAYASFMHATRGSRMSGFWCLIVSLISFLGVFSIDLFRRVGGKRGFAAKMVALTLCGAMTFEWSRMLFLANRYLFNGVFRVA